MHFGSLGGFGWVGCSVMWRGNVETFHQQLASWAYFFFLYRYKIVALNCGSWVWSKCHTYFATIKHSVLGIYKWQHLCTVMLSGYFLRSCLSLASCKTRFVLLSLIYFVRNIMDEIRVNSFVRRYWFEISTGSDSCLEDEVTGYAPLDPV
jgi:hypothetical protein